MKVSAIGAQSPLVSVIVPAYNAQSTLAETLASLVGQRFQDFEIIIVDDGSLDDTAKIAREFCAKEPRARLLQQTNQGVAAARNAGLSAALGAFIAPLDADDVWHTEFLSLVVDAALAAAIPPVMVYALSRTIDEVGNIVGTSFATTVSGPAFFRSLMCNPVGNGSAALMRRDACLDAGGYDPRLRGAGVQGCEDYLMTLRLAARGPFIGIDRYLVGYRLHPGSMSRNVARMTASETMMRILVDRECALLSPPRLLRWVEATMRLKRAWAASQIGKPARAAYLLATAMLRDPRAVVTAVTGRIMAQLWRTATSRQFSLSDEPAGVSDCPNEPALRPGLYMRLQAERMRRLAALDNNAYFISPDSLNKHDGSRSGQTSRQ